MYATSSTASKRTPLQTLLLAINKQQNETRETIVELRNVVGRQQDLCEELRQARDEARDVVCKQHTMV
ncbi:hypothetical protein N658DRAFT_501357 [Parathielavia hyrcaniae]|uniref:Uncharacterized protein n=1 Tax=Parathielavia hyrcaniae TaxID=113614 RepID=A0AAN6SWQ1_9PEZI|nr:hypothetical protein N658DRAFT_501357 [Parathielavia hyrcaniae]